MPQAQYQNRKRLPLNLYGHGPFCKFRIPNDKRFAGVHQDTDLSGVVIGRIILWFTGETAQEIKLVL
jgi:hypothetical protein